MRHGDLILHNGAIRTFDDTNGALDAATRGYLLVEGRIAASGSSAELRSTDAVRQRVLGM